jgi:hypothetical protein
MARYDDINTTFIGYFTVLSAGFLLAIVFAFQAMAYYWEYSEEQRKFSDSEYKGSTEILSEQKKNLSGYEWVKVPAIPATPDSPAVPESKRLQIDIKQAMEIIVKENQKPAATPSQT